MEKAAEKLIVALDDLDKDQALRVVESTKAFAHTFKIGLSLFSAHGPQIVQEIKAQGVEVFLDLKFHDIPMQVRKAIENVIELKPKYLTCHALGGKKMLFEAMRALEGTSTMLLAVSILTSLDHGDYLSFGFSGTIESGVVRLIDLALGEGVVGFVASPHEVKSLRKQFGNRCFVVCPGVRSRDGVLDDQSRVMTAHDAILQGADALVVGRPITKAENMQEAAHIINEEVSDAMKQLCKTEQSAQEQFV